MTEAKQTNSGKEQISEDICQIHTFVFQGETYVTWFSFSFGWECEHMLGINKSYCSHNRQIPNLMYICSVDWNSFWCLKINVSWEIRDSWLGNCSKAHKPKFIPTEEGFPALLSSIVIKGWRTSENFEGRGAFLCVYVGTAKEDRLPEFAVRMWMEWQFGMKARGIAMFDQFIKSIFQ